MKKATTYFYRMEIKAFTTHTVCLLGRITSANAFYIFIIRKEKKMRRELLYYSMYILCIIASYSYRVYPVFWRWHKKRVRVRRVHKVWMVLTWRTAIKSLFNWYYTERTHLELKEKEKALRSLFLGVRLIGRLQNVNSFESKTYDVDRGSIFFCPFSSFAITIKIYFKANYYYCFGKRGFMIMLNNLFEFFAEFLI